MSNMNNTKTASLAPLILASMTLRQLRIISPDAFTNIQIKTIGTWFSTEVS